MTSLAESDAPEMRLWVAPDGYDNPTIWTDGPVPDFPRALLVRVPSNADLFDWIAHRAKSEATPPARNAHSVHKLRQRSTCDGHGDDGCQEMDGNFALCYCVTPPAESVGTLMTTATDPLDTLRDHVSVWKARAASLEMVEMDSPAAAYRLCAADVESVLTVIEAALTVARDFVCWLPEHEVWVASGSHPTTAARAFAEALNDSEVEG